MSRQKALNKIKKVERIEGALHEKNNKTNMKKTLLLLAGLTLIAGSAMAAEVKANTEVNTSQNKISVSTKVEANSDWKAKITAYKKEKAELIAEVKAGKITKEDARNTWRKRISDLRAEKRAFFEARLNKIEARANALKEIDPEISKKVENRLSLVKERRAKVQQLKKEFISKIESGEISKDEAREEIKKVREKFRNKRKEFMGIFKAEREKDRAEFKAKINSLDKEKRAYISEKFGIDIHSFMAEYKAELNSKKEENKKIRFQLNTDIKAGKITSKEANQKREEIHQSFKVEREKIREEMKDVRKDFWGEIKEDSKVKDYRDKKEELKEERQEKIKEIREVNINFGVEGHHKKTGGFMSF